MCDYCLPHQVVGPKDIGIDYICEWVYGDRPTGFLFIVQVKTFSENTAQPKFRKVNTGLNSLDEYQISNSNLKVDENTLNYWRGLGLPAYLFAVVEGKGVLDCYYKRFTPILTGADYKPYTGFFKVNDGDSFIAFKYPDARSEGFARDLFIDHVHWSYHKGAVEYPDPRTIGLNDFKEGGVFVDIFPTYKTQILSVYNKTKQYLEQLGMITL